MMLRSLKVAVPFPMPVLTVSVPESVPPPALLANATVMKILGAFTVLPNWSCCATTTPPEPPLMNAPAVVAVGGFVKPTFAAAPALTFTVGVWLRPMPLTVAEIVLDSAVVEVNVDVATPLEFVSGGDVKLLPEPVAAGVTVAPCTGLPN